MSAPTSAVPKPITSRTDAAGALAALAKLNNELNALLAERDQAVLRAQATHEAKIGMLAAEIALQEERVKGWAEKNRAKEFGEGKSLELPRGTIGFRLGQRSLATLEKWTWARVLSKLKGRWMKYRRLKADVNRRALLDDATPDPKGKVKLTAEQLRQVGLQVVQEESFFVDIRSETPGLTTKP